MVLDTFSFNFVELWSENVYKSSINDVCCKNLKSRTDTCVIQ